MGLVKALIKNLQASLARLLQDEQGNEGQILTFVKTKIGDNIFWFGLFCMVGVGLFLYSTQLNRQVSSSNSGGEVAGISITATSASASLASSPIPSISQIEVDINGAVNQPGVKVLKQGDRVQDAISAAGGFSSEADGTYIAQQINLAQSLVDGDKIYIPVKGEKVQTGQPLPKTASSSKASSTTTKPSGLISINHGTESDLEGLPGIGATYAGYIMTNRPHSSVDDLCSRNLFRSKSTCDKLRPYITL